MVDLPQFTMLNRPLIIDGSDPYYVRPWRYCSQRMIKTNLWKEMPNEAPLALCFLNVDRVDASSTKAHVPPRQPPKRSNPLQIVNGRGGIVYSPFKEGKVQNIQTTYCKIQAVQGQGSVVRLTVQPSPVGHIPRRVESVTVLDKLIVGGISYSLLSFETLRTTCSFFS